jgi:hypothetical protein
VATQGTLDVMSELENGVVSFTCYGRAWQPRRRSPLSLHRCRSSLQLGPVRSPICGRTGAGNSGGNRVCGSGTRSARCGYFWQPSTSALARVGAVWRARCPISANTMNTRYNQGGRTHLFLMTSVLSDNGRTTPCSFLMTDQDSFVAKRRFHLQRKGHMHYLPDVRQSTLI